MQGLFCFILEPVLLSVLFVCFKDAFECFRTFWTVGLDPTKEEAKIIPHYLRGFLFSEELVEVGLFGFFRFHDVTIPQIEMIASFILFFFSLHYRELVECIDTEVDAEGRRLGQIAPVFNLVK